jgi:hypothetical protein
MLCQTLCYDETRLAGWFSYLQTFFENRGYPVSLEFINQYVFKRSASFEEICDGRHAPHSQRYTKAM